MSKVRQQCMDNTTQKFNYKRNNKPLITIGVTMMACVLWMGSLAIDNNEDVHLGAYTLSPSDTTLFLWGVSILSGYYAFDAFCRVFINLSYPIQVELHATYACLPKLSMFGGQLSIPYELIKDITRRKISTSEELLVIKSGAGESRLFLSALSRRVSLTGHSNRKGIHRET